MTQPIMSLDVITDTAYRAAPKFDVRTPRAGSGRNGPPLQALVRSSVDPDMDKYATVGLYNPELAEFVSATSEAVTKMVNSDEWLRSFGLKANHLDAISIARRLGFKHAKNFDNILRKEVSSIYGENLFCRFMQIDGREYNITATKSELNQAITGLSKSMDLFRKRLDWLTHGSRKIFGLMTEKRVTLLVDFQILSVLEFEQFCLAFERLIREQLSRVERFNIIRCDEDPLNCFSSEAVSATAENIDAAIQWLHNWRRVAIVPQVKSVNTSNFSSHSVVDGFLKATNDRLNQAIYLFSNGVTVECCKELLRDRVQLAHIPVNVAAFNCANQAMMRYFGELCSVSGGRLHAYRVTMQFALFEALPYSEEQHDAPVGKREYLCGSSAPSIGTGGDAERINVRSTRDDVLAVFAENETAKELCKQIQTVLQVVEEREQAMRNNKCLPKLPPGEENRPSTEPLEYQQDEYMNSVVWLAHNGVKARRLDFFEFLKNLVFRHVDGLMDQCYSPIKSRFEIAMEQERQQDLGANARAETLDLSLKKGPRSGACIDHTTRLVNAQYCCELFAHIRWPTGELMHVQVSPEVYRLYEERMLICMNAIERRLNWLKRGSRAVFGTIVEDHVYLIIDTSESMLPHLQFLKDRIYLLLQEQLRHKKSMNIITFNSEVVKWKPTLQPINETTLQEAWQFVRRLDAFGTTNTLEALRAGLLDKAPTQAFYLLTDGRPDMPKALVLEEIESYKFFRSNPGTPAKERAIPRIHCISFNCEDFEANLFLRDLAKLTNGRFHSFHVSEEDQRKRVASRYPLKIKKTEGVFEFSSFTHVEYENPVYEGDDIGLLERELSIGRTNLFRLQELRDQCTKKHDKMLRRRQERAAKLDDARSVADRRRKTEAAKKRDLLNHNKLVSTSRSHANMIAAMRERMSKTDDEDEPPRRGNSSEQNQPAGELSLPDWMLPETKAYLTQARTPRAEWKRRQVKQREEKRKSLEKRKRREARRAVGEPEESSEDDSEEENLPKQIPPCPVVVSPELARRVGEQIAIDRKREQEESDLEAELETERLKTESAVPRISHWLRKHGLVARRLTLYDVLKPTFITHSLKYVPILRKYVQSKVYSDIMPFGYVPAASSLDIDKQGMRELSGRSDDDASRSRSRSRSRSPRKHEKVIRLINPLAVDMKKYIAELEKFISRGTALLNRAVWGALTDEQRTELVGVPVEEPEAEAEAEPKPESPSPEQSTKRGGSVEKPSDSREDKDKDKDKDKDEVEDKEKKDKKVEKKEKKRKVRKVLPAKAEEKFSFVTCREACLSCLAENEWPVNRKTRIEQLENEIDTAKRCLEQAREINDACNEEIRQRRAQQSGENASKAGGNPTSASASARKKTAPAAKESETETSRFSRSSEPSTNSSSVSSRASAPKSEEKDKEVVEFKKNQVVIARNCEDGLFYHANIKEKLDDDRYTVEFTNPNLTMENRLQETDALFLLPVEVKEPKSAKARKKLAETQKASSFKPGTPVLVRALNSDTSEFCYAPGVVIRQVEKKEKPFKPTKSNPIKDTTLDKSELENMCELVLYNAQSCRARLKNLVIIKHEMYDAARNLLIEQEKEQKRQQRKKSKSAKSKSKSRSKSAREESTSKRTSGNTQDSNQRRKRDAKKSADGGHSDDDDSSESSIDLPGIASTSSSESDS